MSGIPSQQSLQEISEQMGLENDTWLVGLIYCHDRSLALLLFLYRCIREI